MKYAKKECDRIFRTIIKTQGCEAKGWNIFCFGEIDCAHIVTRERSATRTSFKNAIPLCRSHHGLFHAKPKRFQEFLKEIGVDYDALQSKSKKPTKIDWDERISFLKDILKRVKAKELTLEEARQLES